MEIPISIRLDEDGLLRKQCPFCKEQYKMFAPDDFNDQNETYCPCCGIKSPLSIQFTDEQVKYMDLIFENAARNMVIQTIGDKFKSEIKPLKKSDPRPPVEINEMIEVITGCCGESVYVFSPMTLKVIYCPKCGNMNFQD